MRRLARPQPRQRPLPDARCAQQCRLGDRHPRRPHRRGRARRSARAVRPHDQPEGRDRHSGPHRFPRAFHSLRAEPRPRGAHHRDRRIGGRAAADDRRTHPRARRAGRRVHHLRRRLEHQRPGGKAPADARRARRRGAEPRGVSIHHRRRRRCDELGWANFLPEPRRDGDHQRRRRGDAQFGPGICSPAGGSDRRRPAARDRRGSRLRLEPRLDHGHRHGHGGRRGRVRRRLQVHDEPVAGGRPEDTASTVRSIPGSPPRNRS